MAEMMKLCKVQSFFASPILCQCTAVLNTDVLNCSIIGSLTHLIKNGYLSRCLCYFVAVIG